MSTSAPETDSGFWSRSRRPGRTETRPPCSFTAWLAFSAGGLLAWWNRHGEWLLAIATGDSLTLLWLDVRGDPENPGDADPGDATG
jgi:hypothetical protein